ncbi:MAG: ribonuclease P protein component [Epsilonproteobacteria bacterium]|nr:MAG: ribonuclease P protein component [Campylobacterota bacterium]
MSCLNKNHRIKSKKEFNKLYATKKKFHTDSFVFFYIKHDCLKLGFVASKKVGNAIKRNKAKRRLRAMILRHDKNLKTGSYLFVAKHNINDTNSQTLKKQFDFVFKKVFL